MSPLSLVSHGATQNSHHRLLSNQQMLLPNSMSEFEQRMIEYLKMIQPKEAARKLSLNYTLLKMPKQLKLKHFVNLFWILICRSAKS